MTETGVVKMTENKRNNENMDFNIINMIDAELMQSVINLVKSFINVVNIVNKKILKRE